MNCYQATKLSAHQAPQSPASEHKLQSRCPAKIILSGEHAVVCGAPAIACSVPFYMHCQLQYQPANTALEVQIDAAKLALQRKLDLTYILQRGQQLQSKSHNTPPPAADDLLCYTLYLFFNNLYKAYDNEININQFQGQIKLSYHSQVAMGCGMGSSALAIISTLKVLNQLYAHPYSATQLLQLGTQAEHLQHGTSSGIDVFMALNPGLQRYQQGRWQHLNYALPECFIVHTGTSCTTTGQCVAHSKPQLENKPAWLQAFSKVTADCEQALAQADLKAWRQALISNQQLLTQIGVTPARVQTFITTAAQQHIAVKLCGAGNCYQQLASAAQDKIKETKKYKDLEGAGILLAACPDKSALIYLKKLAANYNYSLEKLSTKVPHEN